MEPLAELLSMSSATLTGYLAVFMRMSALFALMPGFGERSIPARIKLGLGFAITVVVAPAVPLPSTYPYLPSLIVTELFTGAVFGLLLRLFVLGLQTAGTIVAQSTSLAQLFGGNAADPMPAIGNLLVIGGLALAVTLGLHVKAMHYFLQTYSLVPMSTLPDPHGIAELGAERVSHVFGLAFSISAPFVLASVIYNLAIGAINKAMPQLMVAFVGAPLITAGGLFLLFLSTPLMLQVWVEALDAFMAAPGRGLF